MFFGCYFNGAKQECRLLPQQNESKPMNCWICPVCHFPSIVCMFFCRLCVSLLSSAFSIQFVCFLSCLLSCVRVCVCYVCIISAVVMALFSKNVCVSRSSVTNTDFNAVLGSVTLLTSFSRRLALIMPTVLFWTFLIRVVPSHIFVPIIPFFWNPIHDKPSQSAPPCWLMLKCTSAFSWPSPSSEVQLQPGYNASVSKLKQVAPDKLELSCYKTLAPFTWLV